MNCEAAIPKFRKNWRKVKIRNCLSKELLGLLYTHFVKRHITQYKNVCPEWLIISSAKRHNWSKMTLNYCRWLHQYLSRNDTELYLPMTYRNMSGRTLNCNHHMCQYMSERALKDIDLVWDFYVQNDIKLKNRVEHLNQKRNGWQRAQGGAFIKQETEESRPAQSL